MGRGKEDAEGGRLAVRSCVQIKGIGFRVKGLGFRVRVVTGSTLLRLSFSAAKAKLFSRSFRMDI